MVVNEDVAHITLREHDVHGEREKKGVERCRCARQQL